MELKRNLSAAHLSSASACSDSNKRRATPTPTEDSPLGQLFNDACIHAWMKEVEYRETLVQDGKKFLISLRRIMDNFHEKSATDIYNEALHLWEFDSLVNTFAYAGIKELRDKLRDKLAFYASGKSAAERMDSMIKDPWLKYILGDDVLGLEKSDAFIRGFLSILIVYWNVKDVVIKYNLARFEPNPYAIDVKVDKLSYVIDHVEDMKPLRKLLESNYGSDPNAVDILFEKMRKQQLNKRIIPARSLVPGKKAMITVVASVEGPEPFCGVLGFNILEE